MILKVADLGTWMISPHTMRSLTVDEDILPGATCRMLLLDLHFHDLGGMLNDLGDVRDVTCWVRRSDSLHDLAQALTSDFAKDSLADPESSSRQPILLIDQFPRRKSSVPKRRRSCPPSRMEVCRAGSCLLY